MSRAPAPPAPHIWFSWEEFVSLWPALVGEGEDAEVGGLELGKWVDDSWVCLVFDFKCFFFYEL